MRAPKERASRGARPTLRATALCQSWLLPSPLPRVKRISRGHCAWHALFSTNRIFSQKKWWWLGFYAGEPVPRSRPYSRGFDCFFILAKENPRTGMRRMNASPGENSSGPGRPNTRGKSGGGTRNGFGHLREGRAESLGAMGARAGEKNGAGLGSRGFTLALPSLFAGPGGKRGAQGALFFPPAVVGF